MPVYDYLCATCGPFTAIRPMAEFEQPQPCGHCGEPAPRALLTAPAMSGLDPSRRHAAAVNERSAHAPARIQQHPAGCACSTGSDRQKPRAEPVAAKSFPAQRPWMISH
ncbi:FmdB family zinc ribbon protein [Rhodopila globiformis]|uniref:FmdB family transcriptional regulator n=1 Tax=Rhodopila globiformis TaxID=1071 RepID=A0A2S6N5Q9_RHOGL|nr:zinc ribbon domain-containing protein [Rhodopila globiformis]PPQ29927.1 FmdB family transcriptional regulator [Rhodopila globiformis]